MSNGTTTTGGTQPVPIDVMLRAMQELKLSPRPAEWVLISPYGQTWRGSPQDLFPVLVAHHPLLKIIGERNGS